MRIITGVLQKGHVKHPVGVFAQGALDPGAPWFA